MRFLRPMLVVPVLLVLAAFTVIDTPDPLTIGSKAPLTDLELTTTAGEAITLAEAAGENGLLVMFTCNTCPWVAAWEDRYNPAAEQARAHDIGFVALNPNEAMRDGEESMAAMKARAEEQGYTFPYAVDPGHQLADAFGATRTPEVFLFNADMELVYHGAIDDNARDASAVEDPFLADAIDAMVAGQEIAMPETKSIGCTIKRVE